MDVADCAVLDEVPHRVHRGAVDEGVPRHQHELGILGQIGELVGVAQAGRERLLDEHVLTRFQCPLGQRVVGLRRGGQEDCLDAVVAQHRVELAEGGRIRVALPESAKLRRVAVAQRLQAKLGVLGEIAREVGPPVATADDRRADRRRSWHDAPVTVPLQLLH